MNDNNFSASVIPVLKAFPEEAEVYAKLISEDGLSVSAAASAARADGLVEHPVSPRSLLNAIRAGLVPGVDESAIVSGKTLERDREAAAVYASLILGAGMTPSGAAKAAEESKLVRRPVSKQVLIQSIRDGLVPGVDESRIRPTSQPDGQGVASVTPSKRYGHLTVISVDKSGYAPKVNCMCDCGRTTSVFLYNLTRGKVTTCGSAETHPRKTKSPLYPTYTAMLYRCGNPKCASYRNYGGRGIKVCDEWKNDFWAWERFMREHGWTEQTRLTMDRIDPDKGYCPENVVLIPRHRQGHHRTDNRMVKVDGLMLDATEWSERTGIPAQIIRKRLDAGWSTIDAVTVRPGESRTAA